MTDTPAVLAYRQRRDAWFVAQQEYTNRKGTAEQSTDPAAKTKWAADEPILRAQVEDAERRWAVEGRRTEIEEAQRVERQFIDGSPAGMWGNYRKSFDLSSPEVLFATDPQGGRYVPTTLQPSNALDVPWSRMTLTGRSSRRWRSPAGGVAGTDPAATATDVTNISFEYTSVTVLRPWMTSAVFGSRAWKFSDAGKALSDGARPESQGTCPSYVVALVLARSVTVTRPTATATVPATSSVDIGFLRMAQAIKPTSARIGVLEPARVNTGVVAPATPLAVRAPSVVARRPVQELELAPESPRLAHELSIAPEALRRLRTENSRASPPSPLAAPARATGRHDLGHDAAQELYVLGFVCKRVPRRPIPIPRSPGSERSPSPKEIPSWLRKPHACCGSPVPCCTVRTSRPSSRAWWRSATRPAPSTATTATPRPPRCAPSSATTAWRPTESSDRRPAPRSRRPRPRAATDGGGGSVGRRALAEALRHLGARGAPAGSNRTPFGQWFGVDGVPWCNIFVSYCFKQGADYTICKGFNAPGTYAKGSTYVPTTEAWLRSPATGSAAGPPARGTS